MLSIRRNVLKMKNPSTGEYEGVAAISGTSGGPGESTYDVAVRNGFIGTEEEFLQQFTPDEILKAVEKATHSMHSHDNRTVLDNLTNDKIQKWDDKQDKPVLLSINLPTSVDVWIDEADANIKALGVVYRYGYQTTIPFADITSVSGVVSLLHRSAAQDAGLIDSIGYEANGDGKAVIYFFSEKIPASTITVSVQIQK